MEWHGRFGLAILGLLVFRVVWGFAGSTYARFTTFIKGPETIRDYLRGQWRGEGHNPLGALSVLALLGTLFALVATGVFSNDDIAFEGPLYALISKELSDRMVGFHRLLEWLIIALLLAHLAAIAFYGHVKKNNLIKPMIRGWKETDQGESAKGGSLIGLIAAIAIAIASVVAASGIWIPEAPPPDPATIPSW